MTLDKWAKKSTEKERGEKFVEREIAFGLLGQYPELERLEKEQCLQKDDKLLHPLYGEGRVIGVYEGNNYPIRVAFRDTSRTFTEAELKGMQKSLDEKRASQAEVYDLSSDREQSSTGERSGS